MTPLRRSHRWFSPSLRPLLLRLGVLALALATSGCMVRITRGASPPPDYEVVQDFVPDPRFYYETPIDMSIAPASDTLRFHDVHAFSYTSVDANGHPQRLVTGRYLRSRSVGAKKLIIVLPIWGSSEYPPRHIAHGYARHSRGDAHVIWLSGDTPLFPWTALSNTTSERAFVDLAIGSAQRYRAAVVDIRRIVDWAETRPEIDARRIALIGFSMSSLVAATVLANEPRLSTAVLMMGGARFADIFAKCGKRVGEVREHVLEDYGWSLPQYREFFADLFAPADPVHYAGHYDPSRLLMIDAMFDDCMPRESRDALWETTGRPERMSLMYSHRVAFYSITPIGLNFARRKIYRFLDETL